MIEELKWLFPSEILAHLGKVVKSNKKRYREAHKRIGWGQCQLGLKQPLSNKISCLHTLPKDVPTSLKFFQNIIMWCLSICWEGANYQKDTFITSEKTAFTVDKMSTNPKVNFHVHSLFLLHRLKINYLVKVSNCTLSSSWQTCLYGSGIPGMNELESMNYSWQWHIFGCFYHFYLKGSSQEEGEKKSIYTLAHSPGGHNILIWANRTQGPQHLQTPGLEQAEAGSWDLSPDLPHEWQKPNYLTYHFLHPKV